MTANMVLVIEGEGLQPCKVLSVCGRFCTDFIIGQLLADAADFLQHCKVCFCQTRTDIRVLLSLSWAFICHATIL